MPPRTNTPAPATRTASLTMFAIARALEGGTLMAWSQMAATRQAMWRRVTKDAHTHTHARTHTHTLNQSLTLSLLNEQPWIIHHTHLHTRTAHTQLLLATEGSETSFYFIIISSGIFLGCKGIPGGARPIKLPTPPPHFLSFPPLCTLSRVLVISQHVFFFFLLFLPCLLHLCCIPSYISVKRRKIQTGGSEYRFIGTV